MRKILLLGASLALVVGAHAQQTLNNLTFVNPISGSITISTPQGTALGTSTITVPIPSVADTFALLGTSQTYTATSQYSAVAPIILGSTATSGFQIYGTADQVTNYTKLGITCSSSQVIFAGTAGGTGTLPGLTFSTQFGTQLIVRASASNTNGQFSFTAASGGTVNVPGYNFNGYTNTAASGANMVMEITPTYNQSGTAAGTDLLIKRTETAVGSGSQYMIDCLAGTTGTTDVFHVDHLGTITAPGAVLSSTAPTNGVGTWALGTARTSTGLITSTTTGIQVVVGGTTYTLAVLTTNP